MSLPTVDGMFYPTEPEIRDQLLRAIYLAHLRRDLTVNILPGSDYEIMCTALARVIVIAFSNNRIALRDVSPLTATGDNLRLIARLFGVEERAAVGASGFATITATTIVVIPAAYTITAPNGKQYQTPAVQTVPSLTPVALVAVDTGADTDQEAGTILKWDSAAIGALSSTATVTTSGLTGGADADTDETLRARLLERLATPAAAGNWAQLAGWALASSASVGSAYVYSAVRGPGSVDIAVLGTSDDRALSATVVAQAAAYVVARVPGFASINVTPVYPELVDVSVAAQLPLPKFAGGAGGGWVDAAPWPSDDAIVAAVSGTQLDVTTGTVPALGQHIALWNPDDQTLTSFLITSAPSVIGGGYRFNVAPVGGGGMPAWVAPGFYISASADKLGDYAAELAAAFLGLGPGEKSTNPDIVPRALRKPSPDVSGVANLTSLVLAAITNAHPEILSLAWGARRATGTLTTLTGPSIPPTTADPPRLLSLRHLAIRKE
jgi:uncharacterized phage protein gp47/JayE